MCHLHGRGDAVDDDNLVAPVELVRLPGREAERHEGRRRRLALPARPGGRVPAERVMAAVMAEPARSDRPSDRWRARPSPSKIRISVSRSRLARAAFAASSPSSSSRQGPIFGWGWEPRSQANSVSSGRMTLRTVRRDTRSSRTIALIDFP
jgi:hypothetical protein